MPVKAPPAQKVRRLPKKSGAVRPRSTGAPVVTVRTVSVMKQPYKGSYETAIESAIRQAALCTVCIARKTGVPPMHVLTVLADIGQRVKITDAMARCHDCTVLKNTHRVRASPPAEVGTPA